MKKIYFFNNLFNFLFLSGKKKLPLQYNIPDFVTLTSPSVSKQTG